MRRHGLRLRLRAIAAALIALVVLALEDIWVFLHGGESLFGKLGLEIKRCSISFSLPVRSRGALDDKDPARGAHLSCAVGKAGIWIFDKIFAGVGWLANKIDGTGRATG